MGLDRWDWGVVMQTENERPPLSIPEARMSRAVDSARRALGELADVVSELDQEVSAFHTAATSGRIRQLTGEGVEVFRGPKVRVLMEDAVSMVSSQILSMHPGVPLSAPLLAAGRRRDKDVLARGVAMRTIHSESMPRVPRGRAHLKALREAGADIRTASTLPFRLIVLDSSLAFVPALEDGSDPGTSVLVVRDPGLVALFEKTFEFCWLGAQPAELMRPSLLGQPTARQQEVLRLMQLGYKDEAIAREIGVSSRTMRRIVADLFERLDANSRFSAGMAAQARGWLAPCR